MADQQTNKMYDALRSQWGKRARANGYQLNSFFLSEQSIVLSALQENQFPIVDLACGSGLMVLPIATDQNQVFGLDFNADACNGARTLGLSVVRGDVFQLPFADDSVGQLVNCQFLNQQPIAETDAFLSECSRVLNTGGRLVITWRHAQSWLHRLATVWLKLRRDPAAEFPQYTHPINDIEQVAASYQLRAVTREVTYPFKRAANMTPKHALANVLGASFFAVFVKQ